MGTFMPERIRALRGYREYFQDTSQHPEIVVYDRCGPQWTMCIAHVESEVHRCRDMVDTFLWETSDSMNDSVQPERSAAMNRLVDVLLLRGMRPSLAVPWCRVDKRSLLDKVLQASQRAALAPSPSRDSLDLFRIYIAGKPQAPNGCSPQLYGQAGEPVPRHIATISDDDFEPIEKVITKWLMNPFLNLINRPLRTILPKVPFIGKNFENMNVEVELVNANTISVLAKAFMVMIAILCLTAAILTLDVVKNSRVRIAFVAVFAQLLALPMQFLGPRSLPLYTLVVS
jgi:hypothetical protein